MSDQSLHDTSTEQTPPSGTMTPFGDPNGTIQAEAPVPTKPVRQWTIDEILSTAKVPERHARVCLRGDLEAEHTLILAELSTLVDAQGKVVDDDPERAANQQSKAARAQELVDRDALVRAEMEQAMWYPLFRGLTSDELTEFNGKYLPKNDDADLTEYHTLLIAECSVESPHGPKLSVEKVRQLRTKLGSKAVGSMAKAAREASTQGGVDFPRLPAGFGNLKPQ